ncbi:MAG: DUF2141 domain-containing protein [Albidovulum sp.]|nr:DUF2141 domain-containing protein [Albidovulum sp.]
MKHLGIALILSVAAVAQSTAGDLTVEVNEIRSSSGRIYVAIHTAREDVNFPDMEGAVAGAWWLAIQGRQSVAFLDLPAGTYAVSVFHDENGNGDLDTNLLGMPTEGYGFANDATGQMGPPEFEAASVQVGDASVLASLKLQY